MRASCISCVAYQQVVQDGIRTPQKNSNLVSKAMEYVFGW